MAYDTPKAQRTTRKKYSHEEKAAVLENLDLEVESRTKKMQQRLEEDLQDYKARYKQVLSKIPRVLLSMTIEEFALKYDGSISKYMEKVTKEKMAEGVMIDIESSVRKRKHLSGSSHEGPLKAPKSARPLQASPLKQSVTIPQGSTTPLARRIFSGRSPSKGTSTVTASTAGSRARFASISRSNTLPSTSLQPTSTSGAQNQTLDRSRRPPSSAVFNPTLPPKTPAYPRPPRHDESILSANGSPLANPWSTNPVVPNGSSRPMAPTVLEEVSEEDGPPQPPPKGPGGSQYLPTSVFPSRQPSGIKRTTSALSIRTRSGVLLEVDPNVSPGKDDDPFARLSDSAKKEVRADILKLVERYDLLRVDP